MTTVLRIKICAALCLLALAFTRVGAQTERKLNVLFISLDDLRPNLGAYGDPIAKTPNMDRIASGGVLFNRAYCQQAVCSPSRTSLLTGLRPDETGVVDLETHFRDKVPDAVTLPQAFKNNGYLAFSTGKVFHALAVTRDPVSWTRETPSFEDAGYALAVNKEGKGKKNSTESADVPDETYADGQICRSAIEYLEEAKSQGKPFFIGVGFKKPHAPFTAPKRYWDIYKDVKFEVADRQRPENSPALAFHNNEEIRGYRDIPDSGPLSPEKERELLHAYYACISFVDAQIGKLLQALDRLGLRENTVVVLWGDHGYHLGEQGIWCKSTNYELATRVPLIISAPHAKSNGRKTDALVEFVDVYPTLLDLCGMPRNEKLSGVSLKPILDNTGLKGRKAAFSQFVRPYKAIRKFPPTHMGYSVRTKDWRCTYWYDLSTGKIVERELYNLKTDLIEKTNLAGSSRHAKTEAELVAMIEDYRAGRYSKGKP